jgi:hypothetical protein
MGSVLGDVTKTPRVSLLLFFSVAIGVALVIFRLGQRIDFSSAPPTPHAPSPCLIQEARGYVLLDQVDSLENCGARLEAVYRESGQGASGAYGGLRVFADSAGIDSAFEHGPRVTLIAPQMRQWVDATLDKLIAARDGQAPAMHIGVVRPQ